VAFYLLRNFLFILFYFPVAVTPLLVFLTFFFASFFILFFYLESGLEMKISKTSISSSF
jgi:hypothetical protein